MSQDQDSKKRRPASWLEVIYFVAVSLLLLIGLAVTTLILNYEVSSAGKLRGSGRNIEVTSSSFSLTATYKKDTAEIKTGGRQIVIKPDSVWLDGRMIEQIDPKSKDVIVSYERGRVRVMSAKFSTNGPNAR